MIRGLTDNVRPAFPSIGTLRKGAARIKGQNRPGAELEHFRFTSDRPEVQAVFEAAYGPEPALLHVYLPHATVEANFDAWCEEWLAGGLLHRCDGETMVRWQTDDGDYSDEPRPCPYHTGEKKRTKKPLVPGCKAVGRLAVILPELVQEGFVGYVTLATTSLNDIVSITASLRDAAARRAGNPKGLQGIRWVLRRQLVKISTPTEEGPRARRGKWLVRMEPAPEWVQYDLSLARAEALGQLPATTVTVQKINVATGEIIAPPNGDDDEDVIDVEVEQPATEPPAEADPPADESQRADLVLGMVEAYATTYHLSEMAAHKAISAKALLKYGRGLDDLTGPELEWLAAKLSARVTEAAHKPAGK